MFDCHCCCCCCAAVAVLLLLLSCLLLRCDVASLLLCCLSRLRDGAVVNVVVVRLVLLSLSAFVCVVYIVAVWLPR